MAKKSLILACLTSYCVGYVGFEFLLSTVRGGHEYFRAQRSLNRLHSMVQYYYDEHGDLPDVNYLNNILKNRWDTNLDPSTSSTDIDLLDYEVYLKFSSDKSMLNLWGSPPHFVHTTANSNGFGFYLDGADGFSKTKGSDVDDINSWDPYSTKFYHERRRFRLYLISHTVGATFALGVYLIYFGYTRIRRTQQAAPSNR